MISRRWFAAGIGAAALAAPLTSEAQQGPVARVGVLSPWSSIPPPQTQREPFERGLRERGWTPGGNITIEYRYAEGRPERLPELAAELVRLKVLAIVANGDRAIAAARQATMTIPIVMAVASDAVERGYVGSLARPTGNITGLSAFLPELAGKRMEVLKEALPRTQRVGVIFTPSPFGRSELGRMEVAARSLAIDIHSIEVDATDNVRRAISAAVTWGADAIYVNPDATVVDPQRAQIATSAMAQRLPAVGGAKYFAEAGFLLAYGVDIRALHHRSAYFVDRILRGAKPSDLPIEQPTKFELVINLKTARALGLTIPPSLLARADEIIE